MNDRLAWCSYCEEAYPESAAELHEHAKERQAEEDFLQIHQWVKIAVDTYRCEDWPDCTLMRFTGKRFTGPTFSSRTDWNR